VAEAGPVNPDFERMTKEEIIAWFDNAGDISPALRSMTPATEAVKRGSSDAPMMLASIRLPVTLVEQIDSLADAAGVRRSDIIRDALTTYLAERTSPVGRDEAEHALDVLRRVIATRTDWRADAA
jgi:Arc/MetJ-type ribon-helix-helix transcriptional regulator